jgi:hypothetical protein
MFARGQVLPDVRVCLFVNSKKRLHTHYHLTSDLGSVKFCDN